MLCGGNFPFLHNSSICAVISSNLILLVGSICQHLEAIERRDFGIDFGGVCFEKSPFVTSCITSSFNFNFANGGFPLENISHITIPNDQTSDKEVHFPPFNTSGAVQRTFESIHHH